jgi:hypothetical protein
MPITAKVKIEMEVELKSDVHLNSLSPVILNVIRGSMGDNAMHDIKTALKDTNILVRKIKVLDVPAILIEDKEETEE